MFDKLINEFVDTDYQYRYRYFTTVYRKHPNCLSYPFSETHPYSFVQHIHSALRFICSLCFTEEGNGLLFQRFTIFSFNLLKGILLCMEYRPAKNLEDTKVNCVKLDFLIPG
jgi:hypothetical protein